MYSLGATVSRASSSAKKVYSADEAYGVNEFLQTVLHPVPNANFHIPDLNTNQSIPKTIDYNLTLSSATAPTGFNCTGDYLFHFTPQSKFSQIDVYANAIGNGIDTSQPYNWVYVASVVPSQQLKDNFSLVRYVAGALKLNSSTISASSVSINGQIWGVNYQTCPSFYNLSPQSLTTGRKDDSSYVDNYKLFDGLALVGDPPSLSDFLPPDTNAISNAGPKLDLLFSTICTDSTQVIPYSATPSFFGSNVGFFPNGNVTGAGVDTPLWAVCSPGWTNAGLTGSTAWNTNSTPALPNVLRGDFHVDLQLQCETNPSNQHEFTIVLADNTTRTYRLNPTQETVTSTTISAPNCATIRYSFDFTTQTPVVAFFWDCPTWDAVIAQGAVTASVHITNEDVFRPGEISNGGFLIVTGLPASTSTQPPQILTLSGLIGYEAVPDSNLSLNVKTSLSAIDNTTDIEAVKVVLANKAHFGVRSVIPLSIYESMDYHNIITHLSDRSVIRAKAFGFDDILSGLKSIGSTFVNAIPGVMSMNPITAPYSRLAQSVIGRAADDMILDESLTLNPRSNQSQRTISKCSTPRASLNGRPSTPLDPKFDDAGHESKLTQFDDTDYESRLTRRPLSAPLISRACSTLNEELDIVEDSLELAQNYIRSALSEFSAPEITVPRYISERPIPIPISVEDPNYLGLMMASNKSDFIRVNPNFQPSALVSSLILDSTHQHEANRLLHEGCSCVAGYKICYNCWFHAYSTPQLQERFRTRNSNRISSASDGGMDEDAIREEIKIDEESDGDELDTTTRKSIQTHTTSVSGTKFYIEEESSYLNWRSKTFMLKQNRMKYMYLREHKKRRIDPLQSTRFPVVIGNEEEPGMYRLYLSSAPFMYRPNGSKARVTYYDSNTLASGVGLWIDQAFPLTHVDYITKLTNSLLGNLAPHHDKAKLCLTLSTDTQIEGHSYSMALAGLLLGCPDICAMTGSTLDEMGNFNPIAEFNIKVRAAAESKIDLLATVREVEDLKQTISVLNLQLRTTPLDNLQSVHLSTVDQLISATMELYELRVGTKSTINAKVADREEVVQHLEALRLKLKEIQSQNNELWATAVIQNSKNTYVKLAKKVKDNQDISAKQFSSVKATLDNIDNIRREGRTDAQREAAKRKKTGAKKKKKNEHVDHTVPEDLIKLFEQIKVSDPKWSTKIVGDELKYLSGGSDYNSVFTPASDAGLRDKLNKMLERNGKVQSNQQKLGIKKPKTYKSKQGYVPPEDDDNIDW
jgi:hypothetical protein